MAPNRPTPIISDSSKRQRPAATLVSATSTSKPKPPSTNSNPDALAAPFCERPVKNIIFLSPHFPPHFVNFILALREKNLNVLGIGDTTYASLPDQLKSSLTEYVQADLWDYDTMLRTVGYFTSRYGRIDRIDSLNETWLEVEAKLRHDFRVPGLLPADISRGRTKKGMHDIFKAAGIPHPDCVMVTSADALMLFASRVGYPLVLKPNVGVGSRGTFKVSNDDQVKQAFKAQSMQGYVAQPFVKGTLCSWDGMVDRHGKIVFHLSHEYTDPCMEVVLEKRDTTMFTLLETPEELDRYGQMAVHALGLRERWFHLEFFRLEDGHFMILEANLRCPGVFMLHQMNYTSDIDVYRGWVKLLLGEDNPTLESSKPKQIVAHISRRLRGTGAREYAIDTESLLPRLGSKLVLFQELPQIWESGMGSHAIITAHKTYDDMHQTISLVQETKYDAERRVTRQMKRQESLKRMMEVDSLPQSSGSGETMVVEERRYYSRSGSKRSLEQSRGSSGESMEGVSG